MRYWWVNHSQTFRHEFEGRYIWSPKRKRNGYPNRYYDFLREVTPGDVVFSYANTRLQGAGFATSYCYTCPRPEEFGHIGNVWDIIGWRVDINFQRFDSPFRPKHHLSTLLPILQTEDFSPLSDTGDGKMVIYLTSVSNQLAHALLHLAGASAQVFAHAVMQDSQVPLVEKELTGQQEWEDIEQSRILTAEIPTTTRKSLISARVGQGVFKERVAEIEKSCRITFVNNPAHLIGSHIKPWRESNNEERLHGANGLLLTPTADHLFDRGFISFEDNGNVLISPVADTVSLKRMGLAPDRPPKPVSFNTDQKHFLAHHRKEIFLAAA